MHNTNVYRGLGGFKGLPHWLLGNRPPTVYSLACAQLTSRKMLTVQHEIATGY